MGINRIDLNNCYFLFLHLASINKTTYTYVIDVRTYLVLWQKKEVTNQVTTP